MLQSSLNADALTLFVSLCWILNTRSSKVASVHLSSSLNHVVD